VTRFRARIRVVQDAPVSDDAASVLERTYREEAGRLWRALVLDTGDREVASDAVAEAFAQALARGDALERPGAWVWRAAFRIAAGELQRRGRRSPDTGGPFEHVVDMPAELIDVLRALDRLSTKQRASVVLHHYAGYPVKEVARIIGSTPAAVGVHLHRARNRLRSLLEDDDA
jgi:RNA polymerase sigma-70 factor (ECF subfamily)